MRTISSSISPSSPASLHALRIGGKLAHRFDIGGEPGEPVRGALLAVEQARDRPALQHHALAHFGRGVRQQRLDRAGRGAGQADAGCCSASGERRLAASAAVRIALQPQL